MEGMAMKEGEGLNKESREYRKRSHNSSNSKPFSKSKTILVPILIIQTHSSSFLLL